MTSPCIFICYRVASTADNAIPWLEEMIADLRALGAEVLIDEDDCVYHDLSSLRYELLRCSAMIIVQTPETLTSNHVQMVVNTALELLMQDQQGNVIRLISSLSSMYDAPWEWMRLRAFDLSSGYKAVRDNLLLALGFNADSWQDTQPSLSVPVSVPSRATPHLPAVPDMKTYIPPDSAAAVSDMKTFIPPDFAAAVSDMKKFMPVDSAAAVPDMKTYIPPDSTASMFEMESYIPSAPAIPTLEMEPSALPYDSAPTVADAKMYPASPAPSIPAVVQPAKLHPPVSYVLLLALALVVIIFSVITAFFFHQVQANANISVTATASTNGNIVHVQLLGTATANAQGTATAVAQANELAAAHARATATAAAHAQATAAAVATMQAYQPSSYEAEAAGNTLAGGARRTRCDRCSGGERVGFVGYDGSLQFNNIAVSLGGYYKLTIYYSENESRTALMSVNGGNGLELSFGSTGSFDTPAAETTTVYLTSGMNTIAFYNPNDWAPDFDRIVV